MPSKKTKNVANEGEVIRAVLKKQTPDLDLVLASAAKKAVLVKARQAVLAAVAVAEAQQVAEFSASAEAADVQSRLHDHCLIELRGTAL